MQHAGSEKKVLRAVYAGKTMPYARAVVAGGFVYCSGMAGVDPETRSIPVGMTERESVKRQTEVALRKIETTLKECGSSFQDVVQAVVIVAKLEYFEHALEVFHERGFPIEDMAQTLFEARLNQSCLVEIQVTAAANKE